MIDFSSQKYTISSGTTVAEKNAAKEKGSKELDQEKSNLLQELLSRKNSILQEIQNIKSGFDYNLIINQLKKEITESTQLLKEKQDFLVKNLNLDQSTLKKTENEMIDLYTKIRKNEKDVEAVLLQSKNNLFKNEKVVALSKELSSLNLQISELSGVDINENILQGQPVNKKEKVWIDENMGIFLEMDKQAIIKEIMKCFNGVLFNGKNKEKDIDKNLDLVSDPKKPGLASLISGFIDLLVKAIGNFAKQFFAFKNTIDLLSGFQLGEIFGKAIPGLVKVIKEMVEFFSDTKEWFMKTLMGPLAEISIPIPEFEFDLGSIIPALPFKIKVPKIDINGYLDKLTPFNINVNSPCPPHEKLKIPLDWKEMIDKENGIETLIKPYIDKNQKLSMIDQEIEKLKNQYVSNGGKVAFFKTPIESNNSNPSKLDNNEINRQINNLIRQKTNLQTMSVMGRADFSKAGLSNTETSSELYKNGVNVSDLSVVEYLKKIGYDINTYDIDKINTLKSFGVNLGNSNGLIRLYNIGFSFNDTKYKDKLSKLNKIDINDLNTMDTLLEMGLNINNPNVYPIMDQLNEIGISLKDDEMLIKLNTIGFNFNNPELLVRLKTLRKYIDITDPISYNNILTKNVNLNNPFFENLLKNTSHLNLKWNSEDFAKTEKEIFDNVKVSDIDYLLSVIKEYKENKNTVKLHRFFNTKKDAEDFRKKMKLKPYDSADKYKVENLEGSQSYFRYILDRSLVARLNVALRSSSLSIPLTNHIAKNIETKGNIFSNSLTKGIIAFVRGVGENRSAEANGEEPTEEENVTIYPIYYVSLSEFDVNKYSKYNIELKFPVDYKSGKGAVQKERYFYPDGINNFHVPYIDDITQYEYRLKLLKEYVYNRGWVIDGLKYSENLAGLDENSVMNTFNKSGLEVVNDINNNQSGKISLDAVYGIYGNLSKIGLNVADPDFGKKMQEFSYDLKIALENSVMVDTQRKVYLTYYDYKDLKSFDKFKTIELNDTPINTELFKDKKYQSKIKIVNVPDPSKPKQPTKTIVKLDSLNKMGFNFGHPDYYKFLSKLKGLNFDMGKFDTPDKINSLCSLGWHFLYDPKFMKLDKLIKIGFNFEDKDLTSSASSKLDRLNQMGFNFQNDDSMKILDSMNKLGFDMKKNDFSNNVDSLKSTGIDFSSKDLMSKVGKLIDMGVNFKTKIGKTKLDDVKLLGLDFKDPDWNKSLNNKLETLKSVGLNLSMKDTIQGLNDIGLDFNDSEYLSKINALEQIGLVKRNNSSLIVIDSISGKTISEKEKEKEKDQLVFAEPEKIKTLSLLGFNFKDCNWMKNIHLMKMNGLDFSLPDWKLKLKKIKLIKNPVEEWTKSIVKAITNVATVPIKILLKIIEKLLELIKEVVGIPLNPIEIPDWLVGIVQKFKDFIKMLISLPTLNGITEFLFTGKEGLKLIDVILPKFSESFDELKEKLAPLTKEYNKIKDQLKEYEKSISKYTKEIKDLKDKIKITTNLNDIKILNDTISKITTEKEKIEKEIKNIKDKLGNLKIITNITDVTKWAKNIDDIKKFLNKMIKDENSKPNHYKEEKEEKERERKRIHESNDPDKNNKLADIDKQIKDLKTKAEGFQKEIDEEVDKLRKLMDWAPVVFNITGCIPKLIANIFVGILNSVGDMKFLPKLWNFPEVKDECETC